MSHYILDTDHLTLLQGGHQVVRQRIRTVAPSALAVTIVTAEEQLRGWLSAIRRHHGSPRQIWAYGGLQDTIQFPQQVTILAFDQAAYQQFEALRCFAALNMTMPNDEVMV